MIEYRRHLAGLFCRLMILVIMLGSFAPALRLAAQSSSPAAALASDAKPAYPAPPLRLERRLIEGGAELLTIFGATPHVRDGATAEPADVPLVSVMRDTLGDRDPTNDKLRYVWMHTYTRPGVWQKILAAVPFLYTNKFSGEGNPSGVPSPIIDLANADSDVWNRFFWVALQALLLDPQGFIVQAPSSTYRRNVTDHRKAHLIRALAVLTLYEMARRDHEPARIYASEASLAQETSHAAQPALSDLELAEIGGRLTLAEATFGGIIDDINLQRVYARQSAASNDLRGHNWELLRQRAELEGLYFEPLLMPDGSATHGLLWVAADDLAVNTNCKWDGRFLNIKNPWRDSSLARWWGFTESWNFDHDGVRLAHDDSAAAPPATTRRMIPLALYGLDHPKIPILLVDFRDSLNPKRREMSRRVLQDVTRNVFAAGRFGNLYYFLGRTVYDVVTGRRALDINQPSRLRAYSQLKLLLALDASLEPDLRQEIEGRVDRVSLNPMESSAARETEIARKQYAALVAYAARPDGLSARLARDRRREMTRFTASAKQRTLYRVANVATFGAYTHTPRETPERLARLDLERQLRYHSRFLREVAKSSPVIEVRWRMDDVRRSLEFVAAQGASADANVAKAVARIFSQTEDDAARSLSLKCLYRINRPAAKSALLKVEADAALSTRWREMSRDLLRTAMREEQRFAVKDLSRAHSLL